MELTTLGEIIDKLSANRSKVAVLQMLATHLRINFVKTEAGPPEMTVTRSDGTLVDQRGIEATMQDLNDLISGYSTELSNLEQMRVAPVQLVSPEPPEEEAPVPPVAAFANRTRRNIKR